MTAVMSTMMPAEVVAAVVSPKPTVAAAVGVVSAAIAIRRIEARTIRIRCRGVAVIFAAAMTALTAVAMPEATRVRQLHLRGRRQLGTEVHSDWRSN